MATTQCDPTKYRCADYLSSAWARTGFWDEDAQLWLIEPLSRIDELDQVGFLQVGRAGVDGIGFGYRFGHDAFWAYHPTGQRFQLLAPSLEEFVKGWMAGSIAV